MNCAGAFRCILKLTKQLARLHSDSLRTIVRERGRKSMPFLKCRAIGSLRRLRSCARRLKPAPSRTSPSLLLFDPAGGLLPPRPQMIAADARRRCQGWPPLAATEGLALTASSTTARWLCRVVTKTVRLSGSRASCRINVLSVVEVQAPTTLHQMRRVPIWSSRCLLHNEAQVAPRSERTVRLVARRK